MKQETLKKIVELAPGFEWSGGCEPAPDTISYKIYVMQADDFQLFSGDVLYPLLLHRAAGAMHIDLDDLCAFYYETMVIKNYSDYPADEYLTSQEKAIEAVLLEVLR